MAIIYRGDLTSREAAQLAGISYVQFKRDMAAGKIRPDRVLGRFHLFTLDTVNRYRRTRKKRQRPSNHTPRRFIKAHEAADLLGVTPGVMTGLADTFELDRLEHEGVSGFVKSQIELLRVLIGVEE